MVKANKKQGMGYTGRKEKKGVGYWLNIAFLTIICITFLYPFINLVWLSFSKSSEIVASGGLMLFPKSFNLDAYEYLVQYPNLVKCYENTVFITVVGTCLSMILTIMGAYVLARRNLPGRGILTTFVVITMFISGGLIPSYINIKELQLLNTLWVLILPGMISTWNMLLMRNFFMAIPADLIEAAKIDGASEGVIMIKIIIPLSKAIIATLILFYGVALWNSYSNVIIYNTKSDVQTLQVLIRKMYESSQLDLEESIMPPLQAIRAATILASTLPILCIYPFIQKHFAAGIMVGSVKG